MIKENYLFVIIDTQFENYKHTKQARKIARFNEESQAREYLEDYDRPQDLICIIDKTYLKRCVEKFEQDFNLSEKEFEVLKLIDLNNSVKGIQTYLNQEIDKSLKILENNKFIVRFGNEFKITENGKGALFK